MNWNDILADAHAAVKQEGFQPATDRSFSLFFVIFAPFVVKKKWNPDGSQGEFSRTGTKNLHDRRIVIEISY